MKKSMLFLLLLGVTVAWSTSPFRSHAFVGLPPMPSVVRLDSRLDQIVPPGAMLEKIADGFAWAEGPVWNRKDGFLLFSDVPNNRIIKLKAGERATVFLPSSGYTGSE